MDIHDLDPKKSMSKEEMSDVQGGVIPLPSPKVARTLGTVSTPTSQIAISNEPVYTSTNPLSISNEPVYRPKA